MTCLISMSDLTVPINIRVTHPLGRVLYVNLSENNWRNWSLVSRSTLCLSFTACNEIVKDSFKMTNVDTNLKQRELEKCLK